MSLLDRIKFEEISIEKIESWQGVICVVMSQQMPLTALFQKINRLMKGRLKQITESTDFDQLLNGESLSIVFPAGLKSYEIKIFKIKNKNDVNYTRLVGASIANSLSQRDILIFDLSKTQTLQLLYGFFLKAYKFDKYKTKTEETRIEVNFAGTNSSTLQKKFKSFHALLKGVYFCRDLINEPANILTTTNFTQKLKALVEYGLAVEVLEENDIENLGMRALLAVGKGSECPSKVVIIRWNGNKTTDSPLLLVGKGVVFDSGGISLKPAGGMEEMVMDMGGAGVVAGTMKTIALRKAPTNVVGLIGIVENMPDGKAVRPGDVLRTMKGDTVEVINTDAEGRLVLSDLLWYGQTQLSPKAIIDLATLTGAIIIALGKHKAGIFSNNDLLCEKFLEAAASEQEGAWRLPLGHNYKKQLKSRVADIANVGGRAGGASTAAQFLENFVEESMPWIHIDIAGVAFSKNASPLSAQGATGWGVATLNRFIQDYFEKNKTQ